MAELIVTIELLLKFMTLNNNWHKSTSHVTGHTTIKVYLQNLHFDIYRKSNEKILQQVKELIQILELMNQISGSKDHCIIYVISQLDMSYTACMMDEAY